MKDKQPKLKPNTLYHGDCLEIMQGWEKAYGQCVDLIYLDPPFNSNANYNILYGTHQTRKPRDQQSPFLAFNDTWYWSAESAELVRNLTCAPLHPAHKAIRGLVEMLPEGGMLAYLSYMAERIAVMHRLLKDSGSLYLHCDPTASHYLKMILDCVFGVENYRNEITWERSKSGKSSQHKPRSFARNADIIFLYSKTDRYTIFPFTELHPESIQHKFPRIAEDGQRYALRNLYRGQTLGHRPNLCYQWRGFENPHASGWALSKPRLEEEYQKGNVVILPNGKLQRRQYLADSKGGYLSNVWTDIAIASGNERTGYPTQKPLSLLKRIIQASSNEGDLVLDPFCGCGTTADAAYHLNRKFLGIDIARYAITDMCKERLKNAKGVSIHGLPTDIARMIPAKYHKRPATCEIISDFAKPNV